MLYSLNSSISHLEFVRTSHWPVIVYAYLHGTCIGHRQALRHLLSSLTVTKLYLHYCARQKKQVFFASKIMSGARARWERYRAKIIHFIDYKEYDDLTRYPKTHLSLYMHRQPWLNAWHLEDVPVIKQSWSPGDTESNRHCNYRIKHFQRSNGSLFTSINVCFYFYLHRRCSLLFLISYYYLTLNSIQ